jgi:hypothetical protein
MAPNNNTTGTAGNWSEADSKKLYEHFQSGDFNPQKQDSKYIKECFERTEWLQARTTAKKLYRNYRRHANVWLSEQGKNGARRKSISSLLLPLFVCSAAHNVCFAEPPPVPVAAVAEEEPADIESVEDSDEEKQEEEEEEDFEIVEPSNSFVEVGQVGEVEMTQLPPKKAPVKAGSVQNVTLPYTMSVIEDEIGYKYVRLEIQLLTGMTEQTIHAFVDKTRDHLKIKYYLPSFCTDPDRLDEGTEDAEWMFNTNVKTVYAKQGRAVETAFNNDPVYCMQSIKLPFACEKTFSKTYGGRAAAQYVKMIEHEDATFASNMQYYYFLVIHLDSVDKPVVIDKAGPRFVVSKKPAARRPAAGNPWEPAAVESGGLDLDLEPIAE